MEFFTFYNIYTDIFGLRGESQSDLSVHSSAVDVKCDQKKCNDRSLRYWLYRIALFKNSHNRRQHYIQLQTIMLTNPNGSKKKCLCWNCENFWLGLHLFQLKWSNTQAGLRKKNAEHTFNKYCEILHFQNIWPRQKTLMMLKQSTLNLL